VWTLDYHIKQIVAVNLKRANMHTPAVAQSLEQSLRSASGLPPAPEGDAEIHAAEGSIRCAYSYSYGLFPHALGWWCTDAVPGDRVSAMAQAAGVDLGVVMVARVMDAMRTRTILRRGSIAMCLCRHLTCDRCV